MNFLQLLFAVIMLILVLQLEIDALSNIAAELLELLHGSFMLGAIRLITKTISYLFLGVIIVVFIVQCYIVNPNVIENNVGLTFFILSLVLNNWLKLLFGELRPFMYARLHGMDDVEIIDCETDFGMPSGHVFLVVSLYYLFKETFFREKRSVIEKEMQEINEDHHLFTQYFFNVQEQEVRYTDCQYKVRGRAMKLGTFKALFISYIALVALCRYLAASHFVLQVFFGYLVAMLWSRFYFRYLR